MMKGEEIVARLDAGKPKERVEAAADLVDHCRFEPEAREKYLLRFVTLLSDDAPGVRGQAIVGVVLCDEHLQHVDRVARLLEDPSPGVRLQAVATLAPLGLPELHDRFAHGLQDEDPHVRVTCAATLAAAGDVRSVDVLLDGAERRNTRGEALAAMLHVAGKAADRRGAMEATARKVLGKLMVNRYERVAAAGVLAALGLEEGRAYLLDRVKRKGVDSPMAMEISGELRIPGTEKLLLEIAADRKDPFRGTALRAIASFGDEAAARSCALVLLDDAEDPDVRCDAAEGLLLTGRPDAEEPLRAAAEGARDERVRKVAQICLSLWGKPPGEIRLYLPITGEELVS